MSPEISEFILAIKQHAALYWNIPLIKAHKEVYIGAILGAAIMARMGSGPLKLAAFILAFYTPYFYFSFFA